MVGCMVAARAGLLVGILSLLAGCSVHPVQQDVTRLKTVQLVQQIRCETRRGIQDKAIELLRRFGDSTVAEALDADRRGFFKFTPSGLDSRERAFYARYINTAIAYDFTFDIVEDNKVEANVDPVLLITRGTLGVGLKGGAQFNRSNVRRFVVAEDFGDLLKDEKLVCDAFRTSEDFFYPISGTVGIGELVDTFIELNQGKQLETLEKSSPRVFADTLQFTTTISGSANPRIVLAGLNDRVGLDQSVVGGSASRVDRHQLIVGLSMDETSRRPSNLAGLLRGTALLRSTSRGPAGRSNKQRAIDAIGDQRLNSFYDRFGGALR